MPTQKPGRSKQDYGTPPEFLAKVKERLSIEDFDIDLAASPTNKVTTRYFGAPDLVMPWNGWEGFEGYDALTHSWKREPGWRWNWLNPPYAKIGAWVKKAWEEQSWGAKTAVLIPAAVGSNWWRDWVHHKAHVIFLNGRLTFVGTPPNPKTGKPDPYVKDCALLLYGLADHGYDVWNWNNSPEK